jgi:Flp pilus assembly protein TadG
MRRGIRSIFVHRRAREMGQSLVEMALILPIFLLLLMSILDFGRVVYAQFTLAEAVREGTRHGLVSADLTSAKYSDIRSTVRNAAVGMSLAAADVTGASGACSQVSDPVSPSTCFYPDGIGSGGRVVVDAQAQVSLLTPIISTILGGSYTITGQTIAFLP